MKATLDNWIQGDCASLPEEFIARAEEALAARARVCVCMCVSQCVCLCVSLAQAVRGGTVTPLTRASLLLLASCFCRVPHAALPCCRQKAVKCAWTHSPSQRGVCSAYGQFLPEASELRLLKLE